MPPPAHRLSGPRSRALFAAACRVIPGGVNSPVRAWKRLGGHPPVIASGSGAWMVDVDGRRYCDYVLSWGPLLLGHAHPAVVAAVERAAQHGLSFGACTPGEGRLAALLCRALPSMQQVRLVSSGTEATMSALRLARAVTGRELVIKCDGCYHGHVDALLVAAGSGCATLQQPDSAGVPPAFAATTLSIPYNDITAAETAFRRHRGRIAAFIIEPVAGNMGLILPAPGYLAALRALCTRHGALLLFDEVMTGFRTAWGGYQRVCGVTPDLTCLGKVIGGGLPAAAFGGERRLMDLLAPLGPVYQAGTLSGNPLALAAGLATLKEAGKPGFYRGLGQKKDFLLQSWRRLFAQADIPVQLDGEGSMFGLFFSARPVHNLADAKAGDAERFKRWFHALLRQGVYVAPSAYEAAFMSSAHSPAVLKATVRATERALEKLL
jgi:glutamate-1-semialdehyde 2,1-aminomutase